MANYNGMMVARRVGDVGEAVSKSILEACGFQVQDVSRNPDYYEKGDLIATKNGKSYFIEVKTDTRAHETGNLVVELISNVEAKRTGWFNYCKCDKYFFYLAKSNELIIVDRLELRKCGCYMNTCETEQNDNHIAYKTGVIGKISISKVKELCPSFRRIQL